MFKNSYTSWGSPDDWEAYDLPFDAKVNKIDNAPKIIYAPYSSDDNDNWMDWLAYAIKVYGTKSSGKVELPQITIIKTLAIDEESTRPPATTFLNKKYSYVSFGNPEDWEADDRLLDEDKYIDMWANRLASSQKEFATVSSDRIELPAVTINISMVAKEENAYDNWAEWLTPTLKEFAETPSCRIELPSSISTTSPMTDEKYSYVSFGNPEDWEVDDRAIDVWDYAFWDIDTLVNDKTHNTAPNDANGDWDNWYTSEIEHQILIEDEIFAQALASNDWAEYDNLINPTTKIYDFTFGHSIAMLEKDFANAPDLPDLSDDWEEIYAYDIRRHYEIEQSQLLFERNLTLYNIHQDYINHLFEHPPYDDSFTDGLADGLDGDFDSSFGLGGDFSCFGNFANQALSILSQKSIVDTGNEEEDFIRSEIRMTKKGYRLGKTAFQNVRDKIRSIGAEKSATAGKLGGKLSSSNNIRKSNAPAINGKLVAASRTRSGNVLGTGTGIGGKLALAGGKGGVLANKSKLAGMHKTLHKSMQWQKMFSPSYWLTFNPKTWAKRIPLLISKGIIKLGIKAASNPYVLATMGIMALIMAVVVVVSIAIFIFIAAIGQLTVSLGLSYLAEEPHLNNTTIAYTQTEVNIIADLMSFNADGYNEAASFITGGEQIRITAGWVTGGLNDAGHPQTIGEMNPNATRLLLAPLIGSVGHDPHMLLSGFTALYLEDIIYPAITTEINNLISLQYEIWYEEIIETRNRIVSVTFGEWEDHGWYEDYGWWDDTDPEAPEWVNNWEWYEDWVWVEWIEDVLVVYDWIILHIHLEVNAMEMIFREMMNEDQEGHFDALLYQGHGSRQFVESPFDFRWSYNVSSIFGWRIHPISGDVTMHNGIDIAVPTGTEVLATHDGIITRSEYETNGYGHWIEISHTLDSGFWFVPNTILRTRYAHLDERHVSVGDEVLLGDIIGLVGNTGASTGAHLHFEVITQTFLSTTRWNPLIFSWIGNEVEVDVE
ncbi:MAG: peptidoglycan DD-metalloendopeptidase family protein [Defluviitaleaceae bacterium]|nr:peptidoglycan DD-metalloendopeptidase family protein [Defluviitaleaceae bacterium]